MIPVEEGKTACGAQSNASRGGITALLGRRDARISGGAVGIAGVDEHGVDAATVHGQMPAIDEERCSLDLVGGEECGGGRSLRRDDRGEIGAAAWFNAGTHGSPQKSTGQRGGCIHEAFTLTRVMSANENTEWFAELRDVHVARGDTVVLHGIDLAIERGEHAVILGPNGCGKSSLIKVLTCECYPLAREGSMVRDLRSRTLGSGRVA